MFKSWCKERSGEVDENNLGGKGWVKFLIERMLLGVVDWVSFNIYLSKIKIKGLYIENL